MRPAPRPGNLRRQLSRSDSVVLEHKPFEFDPGSLRDEQVKIKVDFCGLCHADLSMLDNEWAQTIYPFVPGHEVVGVLGIGGLGHLALQFLNKWGCEVYAFTTSNSKRGETLKLGAHQVVNSRDDNQLKKLAGALNFIISTVNAPLPWDAILETLAPKGRLHLVGVVLEPIPVRRSAARLRSPQCLISRRATASLRSWRFSRCRV